MKWGVWSVRCLINNKFVTPQTDENWRELLSWPSVANDIGPLCMSQILNSVLVWATWMIITVFIVARQSHARHYLETQGVARGIVANDDFRTPLTRLYLWQRSSSVSSIYVSTFVPPPPSLLLLVSFLILYAAHFHELSFTKLNLTFFRFCVLFIETIRNIRRWTFVNEVLNTYWICDKSPSLLSTSWTRCVKLYDNDSEHLI